MKNTEKTLLKQIRELESKGETVKANKLRRRLEAKPVDKYYKKVH